MNNISSHLREAGNVDRMTPIGKKYIFVHWRLIFRREVSVVDSLALPACKLATGQIFYQTAGRAKMQVHVVSQLRFEFASYKPHWSYLKSSDAAN